MELLLLSAFCRRPLRIAAIVAADDCNMMLLLTQKPDVSLSARPCDEPGRTCHAPRRPDLPASAALAGFTRQSAVLAGVRYSAVSVGAIKS